jgi:hypothetical protein
MREPVVDDGLDCGMVSHPHGHTVSKSGGPERIIHQIAYLPVADLRHAIVHVSEPAA